MKRLIIDASVAVKWVIQEAETEGALHLRRGAELLAPDLILAESSNILCKAVRRGELTAELAVLAADTLLASAMVLSPLTALIQRATRMAIELDHPAYDCFYLALAEAEGCPLATAEAKLARKIGASAATWPTVLSIHEAVTLVGPL